MRAFISLDICTKTQKEIAKVLKQLQKKHWKVKWEQPEKLHLTLVFLGSIDKNQLKIVYQSIKKAVKNKPLFSILYKGLSCFPSYDYPQIIYKLCRSREHIMQSTGYLPARRGRSYSLWHSHSGYGFKKPESFSRLAYLAGQK